MSAEDLERVCWLVCQEFDMSTLGFLWTLDPESDLVILKC